MQVLGVHAFVPHTFRPPPPHSCPASQLPHSTLPPQPSGALPHEAPSCSQVFGLHGGAASATFSSTCSATSASCGAPESFHGGLASSEPPPHAPAAIAAPSVMITRRHVSHAPARLIRSLRSLERPRALPPTASVGESILPPHDPTRRCRFRTFETHVPWPRAMKGTRASRCTIAAHRHCARFGAGPRRAASRPPPICRFPRRTRVERTVPPRVRCWHRPCRPGRENGSDP